MHGHFDISFVDVRRSKDPFDVCSRERVRTVEISILDGAQSFEPCGLHAGGGQMQNFDVRGVLEHARCPERRIPASPGVKGCSSKFTENG